MIKWTVPARVLNGEKAAVDLECLYDKLGGNGKQILRCLEIFKTDVPGSLEIIRSGLKTRERRDAKNSCHGLRGVLLTMEMEKAAATATILETLIIEKKFETCREILPILEDEIQEAIRFIENSITVTE